MDIKTSDYRVWYDDASRTIFFEGSLRLSGVDDYTPIADLLNQSLAASKNDLVWDLRELEFLNSSGINVLYKFLIMARKDGNVMMTVKGSNGIPWQQKSMPNMKKFLPSLTLMLT
jgi:hypothetical protein